MTLHNTDFVGEFPVNPEDLKELPSYVKWEDKETPKAEADSLTLIKVSDNSWFMLVQKGASPLLSCNLTKAETKEGKEWTVSEIGQHKSISTFKEAWEFVSQHAWGLSVSMSNDNERPQVEKAAKIKMRLK